MPKFDFGTLQQEATTSKQDIEKQTSKPKVKSAPKKRAKKKPLKIITDTIDIPPEIEVVGSSKGSKNLQTILTKDEALLDIISELKQLKQENHILKIELETIKQGLEQTHSLGIVLQSQSILVKRMCITVLKQYQNSLTTPLAEDAIELLKSIGYDPEQIIKEIKKTKRKS